MGQAQTVFRSKAESRPSTGGKTTERICCSDEEREKEERLLNELWKKANICYKGNMLTDAEDFYNRAASGYTKLFGDSHASTLATKNCLGTLKWKMGQLPEALALYETVLDGREASLGADHPLVLSTVQNLAMLLQVRPLAPLGANPGTH